MTEFAKPMLLAQAAVRLSTKVCCGLSMAISLSATAAPGAVILPAKIFGQVTANGLAGQGATVTARGAPGNWQATIVGPEVVLRNQKVTSASLQPAGTQSGKITRVRWQIMSATPAPIGLNIYLCDSQRCTGVGGALSGETPTFAGDTAATAFTINFIVTGAGRLAPPWRSGNLSILTDFE